MGKWGGGGALSHLSQWVASLKLRKGLKSIIMSKNLLPKERRSLYTVSPLDSGILDHVDDK